MNYLAKPKPIYCKKYKQKEHGILLYAVRAITSPLLLLAWLILFKEKLDKCKFKIKFLEEENNRKDSAIATKDDACREYRKKIEEQQEEETAILEQVKRITQIGNRVKIEESKIFDGNINKFLGGFYNG